MIAGFGVLLDQPILVIGPLLVGPEFGPLVGVLISVTTVPAAADAAVATAYGVWHGPPAACCSWPSTWVAPCPRAC
jgi:hypothetical protein